MKRPIMIASITLISAAIGIYLAWWINHLDQQAYSDRGQIENTLHTIQKTGTESVVVSELNQERTEPTPEEPSMKPVEPEKSPDPIIQKKIDYCTLDIDQSRNRNLVPWKTLIQNYSLRHYNENTWQLDPKVIVLHYTVSQGFPWNLVNTDSFANEKPGLAVHYVVDGVKIWQLLPDTVRSRGAYGINHRAINIEMVAMDADDLSRRKNTLGTSTKLVQCLQQRHQIPITKIYSHEDVSSMDKNKVPEAYDKVRPQPYGKIDPGKANMAYILYQLKANQH